jgi:hypothetical protein
MVLPWLLASLHSFPSEFVRPDLACLSAEAPPPRWDQEGPADRAPPQSKVISKRLELIPESYEQAAPRIRSWNQAVDDLITDPDELKRNGERQRDHPVVGYGVEEL